MTALSALARAHLLRRAGILSFIFVALDVVYLWAFPQHYENISSSVKQFVAQSTSSRWHPGSSSRCNPYDSLGYLSYGGSNPHSNRWMPFSSNCQSPALVASLAKASWEISPPALQSALHTSNNAGWLEAEYGPDGEEWHDVEWARGKTILYFGDSISRFNTVYFCQMLGEELIGLDWTHPWSPPEVNKTGPFKLPDVQPLPPADQIPIPTAPLRAKHSGHQCYVPGIDLLLIQMHSYGFDQDDYWVGNKAQEQPYTFEDRLSYLAKGYLDRAKALSGRARTAPEMVILGSALWDLAKWMNLDAANGVSIETPLTDDRLQWYRSRVRDIIFHTKNLFPSSSIKWISNHYPIRGGSGSWFGQGKHQGDYNLAHKMIRLTQTNAAAQSAYEDLDDVASPHSGRILGEVGTNRWGDLIVGTEALQVDPIHHKFLPGGYLWADMMLYDLRKVVLG